MDNKDEIEPQNTHTPNNPYLRKKKALSKVKRELSDNELTQSGVQKLLIQQTENLEDSLEEAKDFVPKFYNLSEENAVLKEKVKGTTKLEALHNFILTISGILIGAAASFYNIEKSNWQFFLIIGSALLVFTLYIRWKN